MTETSHLDPKLVSLAESVEQHGAGPRIYLQTAAAIMMGTPVSSEKFDEVTYTKMYLAAMPQFQRVSEEEADKSASDRMKFFEQREDNGLTALSLVDVVQDSHVGYSLEIPAIRVPLRHVVSWWAIDHATKKPRSSGGFVGAGFSF